MTDFRALCVELTDCLEKADWPHSHKAVFQQWIDIARAALAEQPVGPTLMERAIKGDATAAKQFLYKAGFTDQHGQWLPQYQPIPDEQG